MIHPPCRPPPQRTPRSAHIGGVLRGLHPPLIDKAGLLGRLSPARTFLDAARALGSRVDDRYV